MGYLNYFKWNGLHNKYIASFSKFIFIVLFVLKGKSSNAQTYTSWDRDVLRYSQQLRLPGLAVGIASGDSLVYFRGIGYADQERLKPIGPDHIFVIASLTKSFTSVVLHQMQSEKKISLNDKIDSFPNKYFTPDRWNDKTTIAHVISHTSESDPIGSNFIYNGGKYNLVYNVFCKMNDSNDSDGTNLPFTSEIEKRILQPIKMDHTITRNNQPGLDTLLPWIITPYEYNSKTNVFDPRPINMKSMQSGPAYGMMSSVRDLVKYSSGIKQQNILDHTSYQSMTSPYYPGSPQAKGWFVTRFEGWDLHWAYGYGNTDAALILRIPARDLTLVMLSSTTLPSESTRLGFGNPLNSPLVCSFLRSYVLGLTETLPFNLGIYEIESNLKRLTKKSGSRIYIEETFAEGERYLFAPEGLIKDGRKKGLAILNMLARVYPHDPIWLTPAAFELLAASGNQTLLSFGNTVTDKLNKIKNAHPAMWFFAGQIEEKTKHADKAILYYDHLAKGEDYKEQGYKLDAMMAVAKYYQARDLQKARSYLERLIRYKDYINQKNDQYQEAKKILAGLPAR